MKFLGQVEGDLLGSRKAKHMILKPCHFSIKGRIMKVQTRLPLGGNFLLGSDSLIWLICNWACTSCSLGSCPEDNRGSSNSGGIKLIAMGSKRALAPCE